MRRSEALAPVADADLGQRYSRRFCGVAMVWLGLDPDFECSTVPNSYGSLTRTAGSGPKSDQDPAWSLDRDENE